MRSVVHNFNHVSVNQLTKFSLVYFRRVLVFSGGCGFGPPALPSTVYVTVVPTANMPVIRCDKTV